MSEKTKDMFCQPTYERALLGFCFKSLTNYYAVASNVEINDVLRPDHKLIYTLLKTLESRNVSHFDSALVINEARKNGVLTEIGGYEYIHALEDFNVAGENLQYYIDRVLDASAKYSLYTTLRSRILSLEEQSSQDDVSAVSLIDGAESAILDVSLKARAVREATNLADGIDEYIEDRQNNPVDICGIPTGFKIFDKRVDGLIPGTLTVVAARPKHGKSTLLATVAANVALKLNMPVLYVDTEMDFNQFRDRLLAMLSGIPERVIKHGGYTDQQRHMIDMATAIIKKGKLFHEYCPGYSVDKLKALYRKYKFREDIGLAVFDYIKSPEGADYQNKKEYQILGDVTTALKDMSGVLNIPFLVATQINRQQDVADSDRILRYADVLSFLKQKTADEIVEEGGPDAGTYRWVITDSRRGGTTPSEGIGLRFIKRTLQLSESPIQFINYNELENKEKEEFGCDYANNSGAVSEDVGNDATEENYFA